MYHDIVYKTIKCRSANANGVSLIIPVKKFDTVNANFAIDTGACCTILSSKFYYRISEDIRHFLSVVNHSVRFEIAND
jgi:hypothetical protein